MLRGTPSFALVLLAVAAAASSACGEGGGAGTGGADAGLAAAPEPPDAGPPDAGRPIVKVIATIGKVEVRRAREEAWSEVKPGDQLAENDAVRTGEEARIEFDTMHILVNLHERSELELFALTPRKVRGKVRGRLETQVKDGQGAAEIQAAGSDAVATTQGGRFSLTADGRGMVAVGTESGSASLSAGGGSVQVGAGMVTRVKGKRGRPQKATRAPRKVLLSVRWPPAAATNKKLYPVEGKVEVGSRVTVAGQEVPVDERGRFRTQLSLQQGRQQLAVQVEDVLGRKAKKERSVLYDATLPDVRLKNRLWAR